MTAAPDPLTAPLSVVTGAVAAPAATPAGPAPKGYWPCPRCGATVALAMDTCTDCGAGFLAGAATGSTKLPVVGDLTQMSSGQRLLVGAALAGVLMAVLVLLAYIGGHLFG